MPLTLDILNTNTMKIWFDLLTLTSLTIIGFVMFYVALPLLLVDNLVIQVIGLVILIGLSYAVFKIINLLSNGIIVKNILKKF